LISFTFQNELYCSSKIKRLAEHYEIWYMDNLKRVIVDFKKLTPEVLKLLVEKYPNGYDDNDIISFRNAHGEKIEAVEVVTTEIKYMVKISVKLVESMENFDDDDDDDDDEIKDAEDVELEDDDDDEAIDVDLNDIPDDEKEIEI